MVDSEQIDQLKAHSAHAWALYDNGLKSNVVRRAIRYLGHRHALRGVVRVEPEGLGLRGNRAAQRKEFVRLVNGHNEDRGWKIYQDKSKSVLDKQFLTGNKERAPILNPLTKKVMRKRYGTVSVTPKYVPLYQYFMHPWQYAAALMAIRSKDAEKMAQTCLAAASLFMTLPQMEKPKKSLGRAKRVSPMQP